VTLRTLDDVGDIAGARVFVRADLNVPMEDGSIADDSRIRATVPTLADLRERGASLVVASHLGRPKGTVVDELRIAPVADRLGELLDEEVKALDEVSGPDVEAACAHIEPGEVVLLENLRFDPGEEANDVRFAGALAELADAYVDDAFGAVHRSHASVVALPELMRASGRAAVAGRLLQREVEVLSRLLNDPQRPYAAVLGGAKISDKLGVIGSLVDRVDALLIGGAMAFTVIAAEGGNVGRSRVERDRADDVLAAKKRAADRGALFDVPEDVVAAKEISANTDRATVPAGAIPRDLMGLDIGPKTVEAYAQILAEAKTIFWNGPMGVFELEPFSAGTRGVANAIAAADAFTVVGGGDSLLAVKRAGLEDRFDHLSTGGGASLEFLEGKALPGIAVLEAS
jgi:phosphoglycerate kinase